MSKPKPNQIWKKSEYPDYPEYDEKFIVLEVQGGSVKFAPLTWEQKPLPQYSTNKPIREFVKEFYSYN